MRGYVGPQLPAPRHSCPLPSSGTAPRSVGPSRDCSDCMPGTGGPGVGVRSSALSAVSSTGLLHTTAVRGPAKGRRLGTVAAHPHSTIRATVKPPGYPLVLSAHPPARCPPPGRSGDDVHCAAGGVAIEASGWRASLARQPTSQAPQRAPAADGRDIVEAPHKVWSWEIACCNRRFDIVPVVTDNSSRKCEPVFSRPCAQVPLLCGHERRQLRLLACVAVGERMGS